MPRILLDSKNAIRLRDFRETRKKHTAVYASFLEKERMR